MAHKLNQVPPNLEVWDVNGVFYLVRMVPGTDPPVPLVWKVSSGEEAEALGITSADRTFSNYDEFYRTGPLNQGSTRELLNTTEDPWEQIQSNYETEVRVKPWLADPEILGLWMAAALEGRSITTAEMQGTEWWRTHTAAERQWLSLNASDPAEADRLIADNRLRIEQLFRDAGVDNASDELVQLVADNWTTGSWSETYAINQIRLLSDPQLEGDIDPAIAELTEGGVDTTKDKEERVRQLVDRWLGAAASANWSEDQLKRWAGELRNNPDGETELVEMLRRHRLALFPEYEDTSLTYDDIAAPWRGVWERVLGETPDESTSLFHKIVRTNDLGAAESLLRKHGLKNGNRNVVRDALSELGSAFGGSVRRADRAIL